MKRFIWRISQSILPPNVEFLEAPTAAPKTHMFRKETYNGMCKFVDRFNCANQQQPILSCRKLMNANLPSEDPQYSLHESTLFRVSLSSIFQILCSSSSLFTCKARFPLLRQSAYFEGATNHPFNCTLLWIGKWGVNFCWWAHEKIWNMNVSLLWKVLNS